MPRISAGPLRGPADRWVDELAEQATVHGFDTFIYWGEGEHQSARLAEEVVPAARAQMAAERARKQH